MYTINWTIPMNSHIDDIHYRQFVCHLWKNDVVYEKTENFTIKWYGSKNVIYPDWIANHWKSTNTDNSSFPNRGIWMNMGYMNKWITWQWLNDTVFPENSQF